MLKSLNYINTDYKAGTLQDLTYLHIYTSDNVCKKMNSADFYEIAKFKNFVF